MLLVPGAASATATAWRDGTTLVLENSQARFVLSLPYRGAVVGMSGEDGRDIVAGLPYPLALFSLETVAVCASGEITSMDGGGFDVTTERLASAVRAHLHYTGLDGGKVDVEVTVTLPDDSPLASWRIAVDTVSPALALRSVSFPLVGLPLPLGADGADDVVALPLVDGIVVHDPYAAMAVGDGLVGTYPADLSLQMATVYDDAGGLYLAARDGGGRVKSLGFARVNFGASAGAGLIVRHAVPEVPGADFEPGYDVVFGPTTGTWYDAARRYRAWALGQSWVPEPLTQRADVPAWWRAALPVASAPSYGDDGTAYLPAPSMASQTSTWSQLLGRPATLLTFGWERHGAWTGPEFWPPRDGDAAFAAATSALHAEGSHAYVYLSGSTWRLGRKELPTFDGTASFAAEGADDAVRDCDGSVHMDPFYASIGWPTARMCPATPGWRGIVADAVTEAARLGVDVVSIDEFPIGSVVPCYAAGHGHQPGEGTWHGQAYRALLSQARSAARAVAPGLAMTCEEPNELYLDLLDGYVSRDNQPDGFFAAYLDRFGDRFETIPLFAAVYHDRALAVAEPTVAYDAWNGGIDELRTSLTRGIATALTRGKVPAVALDPLGPSDPELAELAARVSRLASGPGHDFLVLGDLLRPPALEVPRITFSWLAVDLVTGGLELRSETAPAVIVGAFRSPAGNPAIALANIDGTVHTVSVPLPATERLPPYLVWAVVGDVYQVLYEGDSPPSRVDLALPPRTPAFVAVVSRIGPQPGGGPRARRSGRH